MSLYLETWFSLIGFLTAAYQFYVSYRIVPRIKELNYAREIMLMDAAWDGRDQESWELCDEACSMADLAVRLWVRVLWTYLFLVILTTAMGAVGVVSAFFRHGAQKVPRLPGRSPTAVTEDSNPRLPVSRVLSR